MNYKSTRNNKKISFTKMLEIAMPKDGGLFIPEKIPRIKEKKLKKYALKKYYKLAFFILSKFMTKLEVKDLKIYKILKKTYKLKKGFFNKIIKKKKIKIDGIKLIIINISNGKSLSFKDIAISFLSNLLSHHYKNSKTNVLTSTSGDTGSSCINFLKNKKNIKNFTLYPYKKVSKFQNHQITNVCKKDTFNIAINGSFDRCQKIVKQMLSKNKNIKTMNSINFVRIICQAIYYIKLYYSIKKKNKNKNIIFSIPTGNFGNTYSAYIAMKMGLPIKNVLICTNENDVIYELFKKGNLITNKKVITTNSPSMDITKASNLERLFSNIFSEKNFKSLIKLIKKRPKIKINGIKKIKFFIPKKGTSVKRKINIKNIYYQNNYIIDPHTANAIYTSKKNLIAVINTASFIKFIPSINKIINRNMCLKIINLFKKKQKKLFFFYKKDIQKIQNFVTINKN